MSEQVKIEEYPDSSSDEEERKNASSLSLSALSKQKSLKKAMSFSQRLMDLNRSGSSRDRRDSDYESIQDDAFFSAENPQYPRERTQSKVSVD